MKRKNRIKKIHKCCNHVTRKMKQAYHKPKDRNNKLKTNEHLEDCKIKLKVKHIYLMMTKRIKMVDDY